MSLLLENLNVIVTVASAATVYFMVKKQLKKEVKEDIKKISERLDKIDKKISRIEHELTAIRIVMVVHGMPVPNMAINDKEE